MYSKIKGSLTGEIRLRSGKRDGSNICLLHKEMSNCTHSQEKNGGRDQKEIEKRGFTSEY